MYKKAQIQIFMGLFWIIFLLLCNLSYANPLWINTECNSQNPQLHPTVFEWRFYLQHNEDLIRQGIVEPNQACTHWLKEGLTQGRRAHPGFWAQEYLASQTTLRRQLGLDAYSAALEYFVKTGSSQIQNQSSTNTFPMNANSTTKAKVLTRSLVTELDGSPLWLSVSTRNAGAIDSLIWKNNEWVNAFDHGREIQMAFAKSTARECFNPTEAGSQFDSKDPEKINRSSSTLLSWSQTNSQLFTHNIPAYWMRPGQSKSRSCGRAQNQTLSANDVRMNKTVSLKRMALTALITYDAKINLLESIESYSPKPNEAWSIAFEAPTGYLAPQFNRFYSFNPKTQELKEETDRASACLLPNAKLSCEQELPLIITNAENEAMGICSKPAGPNFLAPAYGVFAFAKQGSALADTTKWNVVQRLLGTVSGPKEYRFTTNLIIGTLPQVKAALLGLFQAENCRLGS
jgi:hypothetical protein